MSKDDVITWVDLPERGCRIVSVNGEPLPKPLIIKAWRKFGIAVVMPPTPQELLALWEEFESPDTPHIVEG